MAEHSQVGCLFVASRQRRGNQKVFVIHSELGSAYCLTKPIVHNLGRMVKRLMGRIADMQIMHLIVLGSTCSRPAVLLRFFQRSATLILWVNQIFCAGRKKRCDLKPNSMRSVRMKNGMNYP